MLTLSNSVHLYARPDVKEQFLDLLYFFVVLSAPSVIAHYQQAMKKIHAGPGQGNG